MKYLAVAFFLVVASVAAALDGQIGIHDPSTVVQCDGRYYTFGTGGTALVSDDGWTWRAGTRAPRAGMAPDLIHIGGRYYQYISRNVGAQPKAEINMIWTRSLDPDSPDYKWVEGGVVVSTNGIEDCNGIDPGAFLDPTTGRLWLTYGSYFGYIRLVELDPKTGMRRYPNLRPFDIAINCEASTMIHHDGWYYLLATHGSCCRGADSGYNIRVGRGRKPTGPFLDDNGIDMIQGGGKLFIGSGGRFVGPGHFGLLDLGDRVQKFSMHWEADFDRGGASVIDIRPLLWKDGWPIAGENAKEGTYEIESVRTGTALELAVEGIPVGGRRVGRGGAGMGPGSGPPQTGAAPGRGGSGRRNVRRVGLSTARSGREPGLGKLAIRQPGRPHEQLPVPGAAEVDADGGAERWWLSRALPISGSRWQERNARWPPRKRAIWWSSRRSAAVRSNCGGWISLPMARGASCRRPCRTPRFPWRSPRSARAARRCRRTTRRATEHRWLLKRP